MFFLVLQSSWRAGGYTYTLTAFMLPCYCSCSVDLPHGAMGWSAVCHCGHFLAHRIRISEILPCDRKSQISVLSYPGLHTLVVLEFTPWSSSDVVVMLK